MKVAMVSPSHPSQYCGISTYTAYLVGELEKIVEVEMVGRAQPGKSFFSQLKRSLSACELVHVQFAIENFGYMGIGFIPLYLYLSIRRKKIITTVHEVPAIDQTNLKGFLAHKYLDFIYRLVVCSSHKLILHNAYSAQHDLPAKVAGKLVVIPHGVMQLHAEKNRPSEPARPKTIGFFGFINENKGIHRLIRVLPRLPGVELVIGGTPKSEADHQYYEALKRLSASLGLAQRVKFLGYLPDGELGQFIHSTDMMVFPYSVSTASGALSIALAYRAVCLVSNIPVFHELYETDHCVEEYNLDSDDDLVEKITALLDNEARRAAILQGVEHHIQASAWQAVAFRTLELYQSL